MTTFRYDLQIILSTYKYTARSFGYNKVGNNLNTYLLIVVSLDKKWQLIKSNL